MLNRLLYNKKIPAITPLLTDNKFASDFMRKQTFSITFCISMFTYKNASVLPSFLYRTNTRINSFDVTEKDILLIIM